MSISVMLQDIFEFAALPLAAAIVFTGIHTWFGLHVLRRNVVFADLALAQIAALGLTIGTVAGHAAQSAAGFVYALVFTTLGAALLTASTHLARSVRQEAFIGVLYVLTTAATILVIDRSPQGAEHVKRMLIGGILSVTPQDLLKLVIIYGAIGLLHWLFRKPLIAAARDAGDAQSAVRSDTAIWDFLFYLSFGIVVTSSVSIAGVLLVFSFLIVPALIGTLFSPRIGIALLIGWAAGALASIGGILGSFLFDAPTGAFTVVTFTAALVLAGLVRALAFGQADERRRSRRQALRAGTLAAGLILLLSGAWLMAAPAADHPLLVLLEKAGGPGPERFMTVRERIDYIESLETEARHRGEVDRLTQIERRSRIAGDEIAVDELRRIGAIQQSHTEMSRGERFVVNHLRTRARERARWYLGLPMALLGLAVFSVLIIPRPLRLSSPRLP